MPLTCDPNDLLRLASPFQRIPPGGSGGIDIYLLCQWANVPTCPVSWSPPTALVEWQDGTGIHTTDLPTFCSTADLGSVVHLFSTDPTLKTMTVDGSTLLSLLQVHLNLSVLNSVTITDAPALNELLVDSCTTITINNCPVMTLLLSQNGTANLSLTNLPAMVSVTIFGGLFASFTPVLPALNFLDLTNGSLTGAQDFSQYTNLFSLNAGNNAITDVVLPASVIIVDVSSNQLTTFDFNGLSNLTDLNAPLNQITETGLLNEAGALALKNVSMQGNALSNTLDLTGFPALQSFDLSVNTVDTIVTTGMLTLLAVAADDNVSPLTVNFSTNSNLEAVSLAAGGFAAIPVNAVNNPNMNYVEMASNPGLVGNLDLSFLNNFGPTPEAHFQFCANISSVSNIPSSIGNLELTACGITPAGGAGKIDDILSVVNGFGNTGGTLALDLGTNAIPTGGVANPDYVNLTTVLLWTVLINP